MYDKEDMTGVDTGSTSDADIIGSVLDGLKNGKPKVVRRRRGILTFGDPRMFARFRARHPQVPARLVPPR